jgi:hypothetical protein
LQFSLKIILGIFLFFTLCNFSFAKADGFYISAGIGQKVKYQISSNYFYDVNNKPDDPTSTTSTVATPESEQQVNIPGSESQVGCQQRDITIGCIKEEAIIQTTISTRLDSTEIIRNTSERTIQSSFLGSVGYKFTNFRFEFEGKNVKSKQSYSSQYTFNYNTYKTIDTVHNYAEYCDGTPSNPIFFAVCQNYGKNPGFNCLTDTMFDNNWHTCQKTEYGDPTLESTRSATNLFNETILNNMVLGFFNVLYDIPLLSLSQNTSVSAFIGGGLGYALSKYSSSGSYSEKFSSIAYQGKLGAYFSFLNTDFIVAFSNIKFNKEPLKQSTLQQIEVSLRYNFSGFSSKKSGSSDSDLTFGKIFERDNFKEIFGRD